MRTMPPGTVILSYGLPRSLVMLYVLAAGALLYVAEDLTASYQIGSEFLRFLLALFLVGSSLALYEFISERYVRRYGVVDGQAASRLKEMVSEGAQ